MTVLIADNSTLVRENFLKLFGILNFTADFFEADDVSSTINLLQSCCPDVLYLDLQMPGGSGFDVLEYLKSSYNKEKPYVIIFSNYATEWNKKKCMEMGADACFDKSTEYLNAVTKLQEVYTESEGEK